MENAYISMAYGSSSEYEIGPDNSADNNRSRIKDIWALFCFKSALSAGARLGLIV